MLHFLYTYLLVLGFVKTTSISAPVSVAVIVTFWSFFPVGCAEPALEVKFFGNSNVFCQSTFSCVNVTLIDVFSSPEILFETTSA